MAVRRGLVPQNRQDGRKNSGTALLPANPDSIPERPDMGRSTLELSTLSAAVAAAYPRV